MPVRKSLVWLRLQTGQDELTLFALGPGTTSVRFMIFNQFAEVEAWCGKEFTQYFEKPGWQDQDPHEIIDRVNECIEQAVEELEAKGDYKREDIKVIGVTNQRETTVVWDKDTGKALHRAIAWPDARTTPTVNELAKKHPKGLQALKEETGLPLCEQFEARLISVDTDRAPFDKPPTLLRSSSDGCLTMFPR